jgi:hypothetical protein
MNKPHKPDPLIVSDIEAQISAHWNGAKAFVPAHIDHPAISLCDPRLVSPQLPDQRLHVALHVRLAEKVRQARFYPCVHSKRHRPPQRAFLYRLGVRT